MALQIFKTREPFIAIAAIVGVLAMISFWFPTTETISVHAELVQMASVFTYFMMLLGVISQYMVHLPPILDRKKEWKWDAFFLAELSIFLLVIVVGGTAGSISRWLIDYLQTPLSLGISCTYGPLVFRGILRGVNVRSRSVGIMAIMIVLLMMGQAPIIYNNVPGLYELNDFVINRLAAPAVHSAQVIIAIVTCITAVRVLIGRERGFLGK